MTTPETSDREVLAKTARSMGEQLVAEVPVYKETVEIEVTGGSGGNIPMRVRVVGVDQGRRGDSGDLHSLRPIDPVAECMLREYALQSSLGGIFDKLAPIVLLTANLRGALALNMQIQEFRREHLEAVRVALDALGVDLWATQGKNPMTRCERRLVEQIVLGTLKNIVGNMIADYDHNFELECEWSFVVVVFVLFFFFFFG